MKCFLASCEDRSCFKTRLTAVAADATRRRSPARPARAARGSAAVPAGAAGAAVRRNRNRRACRAARRARRARGSVGTITPILVDGARLCCLELLTWQVVVGVF
jgi:hypothetical protein